MVDNVLMITLILWLWQMDTGEVRNQSYLVQKSPTEAVKAALDKLMGCKPSATDI